MAAAVSNSNNNNYVENHLPPAVIKRLESGAFQSLCTHLRERSNEVPNIDLMTVSGFCRNCLSKWLVVEARKLSDSIQQNAKSDEETVENADVIVRALDAMGYDEAAQYVYGMEYPEWKKRHVQKASEDQMEKFNSSKPIWASHDKQVLAKRESEKPSSIPIQRNNEGVCPNPGKVSLLSNVCCEDIDNIDNRKEPSSKTALPPPTSSPSPPNPAFLSPDLPKVDFSLRILTVSDRAFSGGYEHGDLSGPMVIETLQSILDSNPSTRLKGSMETTIVPDEMERIQSKLVEWSSEQVDVILTTGGTGFSPRDVTPEATHAVLERPCDGLMAFCGLRTQTTQPLAALSRGTAGLRGNTMIANLPGNPHAVREILPVLFPLLLQAVKDIQEST